MTSNEQDHEQILATSRAVDRWGTSVLNGQDFSLSDPLLQGVFWLPRFQISGEDRSTCTAVPDVPLARLPAAKLLCLKPPEQRELSDQERLEGKNPMIETVSRQEQDDERRDHGEGD